MPIVNRVSITTVTDFQDGLDSFDSHQPILNFAEVTTTGLVSDGVLDVSAGAHVINRAPITVTGDGGVNIEAIGARADITNFAALTNLGATVDPDGVPFSGDESFAEGILVLGDQFNVTNRGNIAVSGDFSAMIDVEGSNGRVENDAVVSGTGLDAVSIFAFGDRDVGVNAGTLTNSNSGNGLFFVGNYDSVSNSGAITQVGDFSVAMVVTGDNATLMNAHGGRITVEGFQPFGLYAQGNSGAVGNDGAISLSGASGFGLIAEGSGESVTNAGTISVAGDGGRGAYVLDHSQITNSGTISLSGVETIGVWANGDSSRIDNRGALAADGTVAIGARIGNAQAPAVGAVLTNAGHITADGDGSHAVLAVGVQDQLLNHGVVEGAGGFAVFDGHTFTAAAIGLVGDQNSLINANDGEIVAHGADAVAVLLNNAGATTAAIDPNARQTLTNSGLIHGDHIAVLGGAASEAVFNYGRIEGDVNLGGGADRFEAESGGSLAGVLILGGGADTVALHHNFGALVVADFASAGADHDLLDLSALGIKTLGGLLASATQAGGDVVVNFGHGDVLTLKALTMASLSAGDFIFAH